MVGFGVTEGFSAVKDKTIVVCTPDAHIGQFTSRSNRPMCPHSNSGKKLGFLLEGKILHQAH